MTILLSGDLEWKANNVFSLLNTNSAISDILTVHCFCSRKPALQPFVQLECLAKLAATVLHRMQTDDQNWRAPFRLWLFQQHPTRDRNYPGWCKPPKNRYKANAINLRCCNVLKGISRLSATFSANIILMRCSLYIAIYGSLAYTRADGLVYYYLTLSMVHISLAQLFHDPFAYSRLRTK